MKIKIGDKVKVVNSESASYQDKIGDVIGIYKTTGKYEIAFPSKKNRSYSGSFNPKEIVKQQ